MLYWPQTQPTEPKPTPQLSSPFVTKPLDTATSAEDSSTQTAPLQAAEPASAQFEKPTPPEPATPTPITRLGNLDILPELSQEELQHLSPEERAHYEKLYQSLQATLQTIQRLERENTTLNQRIESGTQTNQQLNQAIRNYFPKTAPSDTSSPEAKP